MKSEGKEEEKDGNTKIEVEELRGWWEEWNGKERGTKINMTGGGQREERKGEGREGRGEKEAVEEIREG